MKKLIDNYKTVLYSDEPLYKKIYERFSFFDEETNETIHFFDRNTNEVLHIISNKYINFSINPVTGYQNLSHIIIQKSFYKSKDLIMILRKIKEFRPKVFILLYIDSPYEYFEKLCSIIADEDLATIAFDEDEIYDWYELTSRNELSLQDEYILKKYTRKQNKFFDQY